MKLERKNYSINGHPVTKEQMMELKNFLQREVEIFKNTDPTNRKLGVFEGILKKIEPATKNDA